MAAGRCTRPVCGPGGGQVLGGVPGRGSARGCIMVPDAEPLREWFLRRYSYHVSLRRGGAVSDLSVAEAARRLQVSPRRVRALLADGRMEGRRVAGRWLVPSRAVDQRRQAAPASGRPLSQASAWHALAVLARADDSVARLPAPVRSRARGRAEALPRYASTMPIRACCGDCSTSQQSSAAASARRAITGSA
jgi:excisionase family DNA binding protein